MRKIWISYDRKRASEMKLDPKEAFSNSCFSIISWRRVMRQLLFEPEYPGKE